MVNGLDVSDFEAGTDWQQVRDAGYSFAYTKATEGTDFVASTFAGNMSAIQAAGMLRGAYHFFHFTGDATAQAEAFFAQYTPSPGDLPPMLDLEADLQGMTQQQAADSVGAWLRYADAKIGARCVVYMGFYYWRDTLGSPDFSGHPLWVADYPGIVVTEESQPDAVQDPPWSTWTFWQYSGTKPIPGVPVLSDADYFNGDLDALKGICLP